MGEMGAFSNERLLAFQRESQRYAASDRPSPVLSVADARSFHLLAPLRSKNGQASSRGRYSAKEDWNSDVLHREISSVLQSLWVSELFVESLTLSALVLSRLIP